jgi:hypothetical protein
MRVYYSIWGIGAYRLGLTASYAIMGPADMTRAAAVIRSLERRTGLVCCGSHNDGTDLGSRGQPVARHYRLTLGRRAPGGGYIPAAEIWFKISVHERSDGAQGER